MIRIRITQVGSWDGGVADGQGTSETITGMVGKGEGERGVNELNLSHGP